MFLTNVMFHDFDGHGFYTVLINLHYNTKLHISQVCMGWCRGMIGCYKSVVGRSYKKGLKVMILEGERNAIKNVTNQQRQYFAESWLM